ncbi:MAG: hypothetical protein HOU81_09515 [Hamadaea sp.]|uniref:DUF6153 family protein n=1 Tax=Hamadaea sp. TaxID=2024425 RepID=UPI0018271390|nr:DUF6153 family protein [Hamadaea sp.]NUR71048.1 hypothetical protein [Hamadaea sp.]NUT24007.1 hypothetical protein [Hamadaea sp.]
MSSSVHRMRTRRSGPLLLLLLLLAAGVAGMHTLGHASHTPAHNPVHSSAMSAAVSAGSGMSAESRGADRPGTVIRWESGSGHGGPMTDPTVMCLAILGGVALIAFVLVLLVRRLAGSGVRPAQPIAVRNLFGRGPPRTPVGLLLADLSVLRN